MYLKYFFIFLGIIATAIAKHVKFYRKDYTFVFEYDAFYKLHVVNNTNWQTAFLTCESEKAKLFYPSDTNEWRIVNQLKEGMAESTNITDVLIGVHNKFNVGEFLTVDGNSSPIPLGAALQHVDEGESCVTMSIYGGSYQKTHCTSPSPTLFVCKKLDNKPCPTTICPTIDPDYKYSKKLNKCYKVNKNAMRWQEAMQTCFVEGALLAVTEDTAGAAIIRNVLALDHNMTYFVGVLDLFKNGNYYTVKGEKFGAYALLVKNGSDSQHNSERDDTVTPRYASYDDTTFVYHGDFDYNVEGSGFSTFPDTTETGWNANQSGSKGKEQVTERIDFSNVPRTLGCGALFANKLKASSCYEEMPFICEMEIYKQL